MRKDILGQRFDELEWVGFLKTLTKEPSAGITLMKETKIIGEEQVPEADKIKPINNGIFNNPYTETNQP